MVDELRFGRSDAEERQFCEREVFDLVARAHINQAIADQLFLSVKTAESSRSRLTAKLGLQNRAELTQFAMELGLLAAGTPSK